MTRSLLAIFLISLLCSSGFSQDSLRISKEISRAEKIRNLNPDSSIIYAENVIRWAKQNKNNYQIGRGLAQKGVYFHIKQQPDSALAYYFQSIEYYKKGGILHEHNVAKINIGIIYESRGQFDTALKYQLEAFEYFNKTGNQKFINTSTRSIARIYSLTGDHQKALPYFQKLYDYLKDSNDSINLAHAVSDLGTVYTYLKDYEKAKRYKLEAIKRYSANNDLPSLASCWQTLGNIDKFQGNFDRARKHYLKALLIYEEVNDKFGFAQTYYNIGCLEDTLNRYNEAADYYLKAIKWGTEIGDKLLPMMAEKKLSDVLAKTGNFKKAYETHLSFFENSQKVMDAEKQKALTEMEAKFETLQKDNEIAEQKNKITTQEYKLLRNKQFLYASLSFLAIGILLFIIWLYRLKINELETKEKHQNEIQLERMMAIIDSQEKERKRFTSDLHDSFGQLISLLKINISELAEATENKSLARVEKFQECKNVLNDMYKELHNLVFDLMPQTLVNGGLKPALAELSERINRSGRILVETMVFNDEIQITKETELAIYRICQEWINNILKYSDAKSLIIQLTADSGEITLTIEDDGKGFDKNLLTEGKGNGWKNINSRASLINATVEIETEASKTGNFLIINIAQNIATDSEAKIPA